jgi:ankyrin repeat protein
MARSLIVLALLLSGSAFGDPWPLFEAARDGKVEKVRELLQGGAPVDELFCGMTPLQAAVTADQAGTTAVLLRYKPDLEVGSVEGKTVLMEATFRGNVEVVRLLLQAGARPNVRAKDGNTALGYCALGNGSVPILRLLLQHGAEPNLGTFQKAFPLHTAVLMTTPEFVGVLLDGKAKIDVANKDGVTPLMLAAAMGKGEMVDLLLGRGAARDLQDGTGKTALDYAREAGHEPIVKRLLQS